MKIAIFNESFPDDPKFGGFVMDNANPAFIPRVGDYINMGYTPFAKVTKVIWFYQENRVTIAVK